MVDDAVQIYDVTLDTPVDEALFNVPGAEAIFERHGLRSNHQPMAWRESGLRLADLERIAPPDDLGSLLHDLNDALDADRWMRALKGTN